MEANVAICHDLTLANCIFFLVLSHTSALGDRVARARLSLYCLPKISIICVTHIQIYLKFFSFLAQFSQKFLKSCKTFSAVSLWCDMSATCLTEEEVFKANVAICRDIFIYLF